MVSEASVGVMASATEAEVGAGVTEGLDVLAYYGASEANGYGWYESGF